MGLIELHFHEPNVNLRPSFGDTDERPDFEIEAEDSSRMPSLGAIVVGLLFLLVLAVAARKLKSDSPGVEVEMDR
jgi:hypothetical protein